MISSHMRCGLWFRSATFVCYGIVLFVFLCMAAQGRADVRTHDGVRHILGCLLLNDGELIKNAARAVTVLSVSRMLVRNIVPLISVADVRVDIRELGGLPIVITFLKSSDTELRRCAAGALINLSVNGVASAEIKLMVVSAEQA